MLHFGARDFLKSSFDVAVTRPAMFGPFRYAAFSLAYAASSDFHPFTRSGILPFLSAFGDVRKLVKMANAIDDVVDNAPLAAVAAADFSRNENGISRFLYDTRFVPSDFLLTLKSLHQKHVLDIKIGIGYSNLFCDSIHDRVVRQIALDVRPDHGERLAMAHDNVDFCGTFGSFFFGLVQPPQTSFLNGVSHKAVRSAYPEIYEISRAGQMLDDLGDVMIDIDDEVRSGRISPNIILGNVYGGIDRGELVEVNKALKSDRNIPLLAMPSSLQTAVAEVSEQFAEAVSTVKSCVSRSILESFWRYTREEGFPTVEHPRIVKKRSEEAKSVRSFNMCLPG